MFNQPFAGNKNATEPPASSLAALEGTSASLRAPSVVAERLREEILTRHLPPGARLFTIRELERWCGFSRSVVREALKIVEHTGLVEVCPGSRGGVFVRQPDHSLLSGPLALFISSNDIARSALIEAREEIEGLCARVAASRATEEDMAALEASVTRMEAYLERPADFARENIRFHLLVGEATRNPILASLAHSVRDIFFGETGGYWYSREALEGALRAHRAVAEAIRARQSERAAILMARHVGAFDEYVRQTGQVRPVGFSREQPGEGGAGYDETFN